MNTIEQICSFGLEGWIEIEDKKTKQWGEGRADYTTERCTKGPQSKHHRKIRRIRLDKIDQIWHIETVSFIERNDQYEIQDNISIKWSCKGNLNLYLQFETDALNKNVSPQINDYRAMPLTFTVIESLESIMSEELHPYQFVYIGNLSRNYFSNYYVETGHKKWKVIQHSTLRGFSTIVQFYLYPSHFTLYTASLPINLKWNPRMTAILSLLTSNIIRWSKVDCICTSIEETTSESVWDPT